MGPARRTGHRQALRPGPAPATTAGPVRAEPALGNRARARALTESLHRRAPGPTAGALGRQPDPYVRAVLQTAVGRDLGDVRVRTGSAQDALLDDVGVDALTSGSEVTLRRGHDRPGTLGGRALLLHELVHVLQQAGGRDGVAEDRDHGEASEHQARTAAVELVARPPVPAGTEERADA